MVYKVQVQDFRKRRGQVRLRKRTDYGRIVARYTVDRVRCHARTRACNRFCAVDDVAAGTLPVPEGRQFFSVLPPASRIPYEAPKRAPVRSWEILQERQPCRHGQGDQLCEEPVAAPRYRCKTEETMIWKLRAKARRGCHVSADIILVLCQIL